MLTTIMYFPIVTMVKITPKEDVILAAKVFDNGNGVRTFDCETLAKEPERVENAAYMIVVRAVFH